MKSGSCAVLFSGGTDSTCAAALMAQERSDVHLLTFTERGTEDSPKPSRSLELLRARFPRVRFTHRLLSIDALLRRVSYERYWRNLRRHGTFLLSTPGFSSLCWHASAIGYCLDHGIAKTVDGLTRELMHFPGHMDAVLEVFRRLYAEFGIEYSNPVREWEVPPDRRFLEHMVVDRHGFFPEREAPEGRRTTGDYLFKLGLWPRPDIKGSRLDQQSQHDCYPFALFNIFAFWLYLPFHPYERYERRMAALFEDKARVMREILRERG